MARTGSGTQSHLDYVMLGSATKDTKVVVFVRRDMMDCVELVVTTAGAVVIEVGGCRLGGIYAKRGIAVDAMRDCLDSLTGWIGGRDWALLGDCNAHHYPWSLDWMSRPGGRVLAE